MNWLIDWFPMFATFVVSGLVIVALAWAASRVARTPIVRRSILVRPLDRRVVAGLQGGAIAVGLAVVGQAALGVALGLVVGLCALLPQRDLVMPDR